MQIRQDIHIARPPADVFAVVTDLDRLPDWQKGTVEVRLDGDGPLSVGSRVHEVHAAMGRRMASTFEVAAYDPGRAFALRAVEGPVPLDGHWEFEPDGDSGTRVSFTGSGPVSGWMKPLLNRRFRAHHKRLKRLVEQPGSV